MAFHRFTAVAATLLAPASAYMAIRVQEQNANIANLVRAIHEEQAKTTELERLYKGASHDFSIAKKNLENAETEVDMTALTAIAIVGIAGVGIIATRR